jgi:Zn-finger nucleic acid-binding protein
MGAGLAAETGTQLVLEQQLEAPECPVCREYMLEAGEQQIGGEGFKATIPAALGHSILPVPFTVNWYVCPSCYHVSSQLALNDRGELAKRLNIEE